MLARQRIGKCIPNRGNNINKNSKGWGICAKTGTGGTVFRSKTIGETEAKPPMSALATLRILDFDQQAIKNKLKEDRNNITDK